MVAIGLAEHHKINVFFCGYCGRLRIHIVL